MNDRAPAAGKTSTRWTFYVTMAGACAAIAPIGFSRRWLFPLATGTFDASAIVRLHGSITFGWVVFVILQSVLVATGRASSHRNMRLAGVSLGTPLVHTATQVAILLLAREQRTGGPSPREFSATLPSIILLSAGLFGSAIANVSRPEVHKRMMMLATFVIVTPALARIVQLIDGSVRRLVRNDVAGLASDVLVLIAIAHDTRKRGRPHPSYVVGGVCILSVQAATLLLRSTLAWHECTNWLASLVG